MRKFQHKVSLVLAFVFLCCLGQNSFAERIFIGQTSLSSLSLYANVPQKIFPSVHSRRFESQAINIGWGKRGKKIIQMRMSAGIYREVPLSIPIITVNNPVPKDPNYSLLRFSCFSHRGPPVVSALS